MTPKLSENKTIQTLCEKLSVLSETFPLYSDILNEIKADTEGNKRHDMAIAYITPDRKIIYANTKIAELVGRKSEDVVGKEVDKFLFLDAGIYPDWNQTLIPMLESQQDIVRGKHILRTADGEPLFCDYLYFAYRDSLSKLQFIKGIFHDITSVVQTTEKLVSEQEKNENILKYGSLGYWIYNVNNSHIAWSGDYLTITEFPTEEMSSSASKFRQMIHPDDLKNYYYSWEDHSIEVYKSGIEFRIKTKSGKYKWLLSKVIDVKTDPRTNSRIVNGIHIDIDDYKKAALKIREKERQLIQNEENLRKIYQSLPIGIVIYNVTGDYMESNNELLKIFGFHSKKEISKTNLLAIRPQIKSLIEQGEYSIDIGYDLKEHQVYENYLLAPKIPSTRYVNIKIISLLDTEGYVNLDNQKPENTSERCKKKEYESGYLLVATDNTILRRSELDLKMNELVLKEKNVFLSKATEKAQESDRLKSAFLASVSHEIRTPLNAIIGFSELIASANNKETKDIYFEIVKTNNDLLLNLISKILELSKIESGRIDLNPISVNIDQLCRELSSKSKENRNDKLKIIYKYPEHLTTKQEGTHTLVRETLSITDKSRLKQIYTILITNAIKNTPTGTVAIYHNLAEVSLQGEFIRTLSLEDAEHLNNEASVLLARKEKSVSKVMVACSVSDTGIGIPESRFEEIFQRFTKLNDSQSGFGLGLAIAKSLVEQMGGFISVQSTLRKGSTFTFYLPYLPYTTEVWANIETCSPDELKMQTDASVSEDLSQLIMEDLDQNSSLIEHFEKINIKIQTKDNIEEDNTMSERMLDILVAEDIDFNYMLVKAIIGKKHNLVRAKTGAEAVEIFGKQKFNLILMDMKMPEMDGITATKLIREKDTQIPIIAVTAYAFDTDKQIALDAGCNTYIVKPIDPKILISEIDKYALEDQ